MTQNYVFIAHPVINLHICGRQMDHKFSNMNGSCFVVVIKNIVIAHLASYN